MSNWRATRSPSWSCATRSRPGRKPEQILQNDLQNGQPRLTRKTEKASWDQVAGELGLESRQPVHESGWVTSRRYGAELRTRSERSGMPSNNRILKVNLLNRCCASRLTAPN